MPNFYPEQMVETTPFDDGKDDFMKTAKELKPQAALA